MEQETPAVQYFALLRDGGTAETASGLVRRTHTTPMPTDEAIGRDLEWHPTEYLRLYRLGHNDQAHVEVSAEFAAQLIEGWRTKWAAERG
ncbi:MAG: hypothetical protein ACRDWT_13585 [Jatrophihabitantaceae bacterium]